MKGLNMSWADFADGATSEEGRNVGLPPVGRQELAVDRIETARELWAEALDNPEGLVHKVFFVADGYGKAIGSIFPQSKERAWQMRLFFEALGESFPESEPDWGDYIGRRVSGEVFVNKSGYHAVRKLQPAEGVVAAPPKPARKTPTQKVDTETQAKTDDIPF